MWRGGLGGRWNGRAVEAARLKAAAACISAAAARARDWVGWGESGAGRRGATSGRRFRMRDRRDRGDGGGLCGDRIGFVQDDGGKQPAAGGVRGRW
jgi:hypothetical protein